MLDHQLTAEAVVVEGSGTATERHVETGEVAARRAAVAGTHAGDRTGGAADVGPGPKVADRSGRAAPAGAVPSLLMVSAFVLVRAEPRRIADLAVALADVDGVAEVYSTAGEADIVAVVRVRHHDELADVVTKRVNGLEGVLETRTLIAFRAYSRHDLDSMWSLGAE